MLPLGVRLIHFAFNLDLNLSFHSGGSSGRFFTETLLKQVTPNLQCLVHILHIAREALDLGEESRRLSMCLIKVRIDLLQCTRDLLLRELSTVVSHV
jgi:hypothetical protein